MTVHSTSVLTNAALFGRLIAAASKAFANQPAPPTAQRTPAVRTLRSMGIFVVPGTLLFIDCSLSHST